MQVAARLRVMEAVRSSQRYEHGSCWMWVTGSESLEFRV